MGKFINLFLIETIFPVEAKNVPIKQMPLEMLQWIRENSYLEFRQDRECELLFWSKLKDALLLK